jgi:hypothetical protein
MRLYVLYPISTTSLDVEDAVCLYICIVNIEEKHQMRDSSGITSGIHVCAIVKHHLV